MLVDKPGHRSLVCWSAPGAKMGEGIGAQIVPQGLGPRNFTDWLGEQSLASWSDWT